MANTAIPNSALVLSTALANPAGTAIVAANTHVITPTKRSDKVLIRLTNTTASTKIFTVAAGDNPPADAAGQGSLAVSLTAGDSTPQTKFVVLEGSRFMQNDGTILVTVESGTTGNITAFQMP